jgi:hypothetical protein
MDHIHCVCLAGIEPTLKAYETFFLPLEDRHIGFHIFYHTHQSACSLSQNEF